MQKPDYESGCQDCNTGRFYGFGPCAYHSQAKEQPRD